jgi:hypothetical protein
VKVTGLLSEIRSRGALLGVLLLCGCGAGASSSPSLAPATPTATPTPTPVPTPNLAVIAAAAYLAAATTGNAADGAINKAYPATFTSAAQAKRYWTQWLAVERTFLSTIFAIAYPSSMKSDVDAQIAAETKLVEDESELVSAPNDNAVYAAYSSDAKVEAATANIIRHDLGLPQAPLT